MMVKFFKISGGIRGAGNSIDYLLGRDRDREGARLLQGDPDLSVAIADSSGFDTRYTVGCLSFEEQDLDGQAKRKIMASFENTLMAGLERDQYNITWVEHRDKGRLELNFFIPNVELTTGKRLQPYYDRADRWLVDSWKQVTNYEHKLTSPDDPSKKQVLKLDSRLPKGQKEAVEAITRGMEALTLAGEIKSREDVIKTLEGAGFEIARTTKQSISIKNPEGGRNLRLQGAFYEQDFRASPELGNEIQARAGEYEQSRRADYQSAQRTLEQATSERRERFGKRYTPAESALTRGLHDQEQGHDEQVSITSQMAVDRDLRPDFRGGSSTYRDGDSLEQGQRVDRAERPSSEAGTLGGAEKPENHERGGELVFASPDQKERDLHEQRGRPRPEIELKADHENRITTAIRATYERIKAGFEQLRGIVQAVSRTIKRPAEHKQSFERAERAIDGYERAVKRTNTALTGAERAIEQHSRAVERKANQPALSPSQEQFKEKFAISQIEKTDKTDKKVERDDDLGLSL